MTLRQTLLLMLLALTPVQGQELVRNGDFEDSLRNWTVEYDTTAGFWQVLRSPDFDQDPDNEVLVYKGLMYHCRLSQTVNVPTTQLRFAGSSLFYTNVGANEGYYAYATIILQYEDASGTVLGRTMIVKKTPYCDLQNSSTQHLIEVTDETWHDYEFLVSTELDNLPGINPAQVRRITIVLEGYGNGTPG
jgi:hypothetical protein